jgi:hypothetical protein
MLRRLEPEHLEQVVLQGTALYLPVGEKTFHPGDRRDGFGFIVEIYSAYTTLLMGLVNEVAFNKLD